MPSETQSSQRLRPFQKKINDFFSKDEGAQRKYLLRLFQKLNLSAQNQGTKKRRAQEIFRANAAKDDAQRLQRIAEERIKKFTETIASLQERLTAALKLVSNLPSSRDGVANVHDSGNNPVVECDSGVATTMNQISQLKRAIQSTLEAVVKETNDAPSRIAVVSENTKALRSRGEKSRRYEDRRDVLPVSNNQLLDVAALLKDANQVARERLKNFKITNEFLEANLQGQLKLIDEELRTIDQRGFSNIVKFVYSGKGIDDLVAYNY